MTCTGGRCHRATLSGMRNRSAKPSDPFWRFGISPNGSVPRRRSADVELNLYAGEVHALVGENGAGESDADRRSPAGVRFDPMPARWSSPASPTARPNRRWPNGGGWPPCYQEPSIFPEPRRGREHLHRPSVTGASLSTERAWNGMRSKGAAASRHGSQPDATGRHPDRGRPAGGGDGRGHVARRSGPRHGRADRGAVRP